MTERQKNIKRILKRLPLMRSKIKLLERRLFSELPSGVASYSPIGRVSGGCIGDSTGAYAIRREPQF